MRDQGKTEVQHGHNLRGPNLLLFKNVFFFFGYCRGANKKYKYFLNDYLGGVKAERNEKWIRDMVNPHPSMLLANFFLWE